MTKILAFAGSARRDSSNKKLAAVAAAHASALGAEVTVADLADHAMPLYDGDLESTQGVPDSVVAFRDLMLAHDGLVIACPEYNGSITPLLKNLIDWTSRPSAGQGALAAYKGKVAALVSTSPGALGGVRGLAHVRTILSGIGVLVVPGDLAIGHAHEALVDPNRLSDSRLDGRLNTLMQTLIDTIIGLRHARS